MRVEFTVPDHAALIEAMLEGWFRAGELLVRAGAVGKPSLDVELGDDEVVSWQLPTQMRDSGRGDCEDLVIWWVAWLRGTGRDPRARARIQNTGPRKTHCLLQLGDGTLVDVYTQHQQAQQRQYEMSGFFGSIGRAISKGASAVGHGVTSAVKGVGRAAEAVGHGVYDATKAAGRGIGSAAGAVGHGVAEAGRGIGRAAEATYHGVGDAALAVGHGAEAVGRGIERGAGAVYHGIGDVAGAVGRLPGDIASGAGDVLTSIGHGVGDFAGGAANLAGELIELPLKVVGGVAGKLIGDAQGALAPGDEQPVDDPGAYGAVGPAPDFADYGGDMPQGYPPDFDAFAAAGVDPQTLWGGGGGADFDGFDFEDDEGDAFDGADFDEDDPNGFTAFEGAA